jgi:hypothetical protein
MKKTLASSWSDELGSWTRSSSKPLGSVNAGLAQKLFDFARVRD